MSFDVTSLFTNVPVGLTCQVAKDKLIADTSLGDRTGLSPPQVVTLLQFCLNAYQGQFYQQSFGTAMGSPVSVTVANLVMEDVEQRTLSTYSHPPPFWKRYVDDTCTALPPNEVHTFHAHLNTIKPSIQFTYEMEENGILPFLDTEITHSTKVYRKPTHTDKYLDFC